MKSTGVRTILDHQLDAMKNRVERSLESRMEKFDEDVEIVFAECIRMQRESRRELARVRRVMEVCIYLAVASIAFSLLVIVYGVAL